MALPKRPARRARLTAITVEKVRPEAASYLIWDERQPNLALRVRSSGRKTWVVIYSRSGRSRWLHLGDVRVIGLADARVMACEIMLAVAKGGDPAAAKRAERSAGSFADLHQQYLDQHAKKRDKSWRQGDALIRRHVKPRWAKLTAASISRSDVKAMVARIEAPIAANQTRPQCRRFLVWALSEDLVTRPIPAGALRATLRREPRARAGAKPRFAPFWHGHR